MKTVSTGERVLAIVAGTLCLAGAIGYLLKDVLLSEASFSLDHGQILITLFVTMFFLHLAYSAWNASVWGHVAGFGGLFVLGTALLVYASVGKQAEGQMLTAEQAVSDEAERRDIKPKLAQAEAMLASETVKMTAECESGKGKRCDGKKVTVDTYTSSVAGYKARLAQLGVAKPVAPEAERFADVTATFGGDKEKTKAGLIMVIPFLRTMLLELGSIVSFGFAFRPTSKRSSRKRAPEYPTSVKSDIPDIPNSSDKVVQLRPAVRLTRKQDVIADMLQRLYSGQQFGSQDELIELYDVPKATLSDWLGELEANGSVKRIADGRKKRLAAA